MPEFIEKMFQLHYAKFLDSFEGPLGKIGFGRQVYNGINFYLTPVQAWIEKACEVDPSSFLELGGLQVLDIVHLSSSIPIEVVPSI